MRISFFWVMILWVVTSGWIVPGSSSGSGTDGKVPDKASAAVDNPLDHKTEPAKDKGTEKAPPKGDRDKVKSDDTKKPLKAANDVKGAKGDAKEDRPWTIKTRDRGKSGIPEKKANLLQWKSEAQRVQCDTHLKELRKSLSKARTYSVRGDTCATAKHADSFLNLTKRCKNECPDGFLEINGYSEKIIKNVTVLLELGKKACLE